MDASWRPFCVVSVTFGVVYGQELVSVLEEGTGSVMSRGQSGVGGGVCVLRSVVLAVVGCYLTLQ